MKMEIERRVHIQLTAKTLTGVTHGDAPTLARATLNGRHFLKGPQRLAFCGLKAKGNPKIV